MKIIPLCKHALHNTQRDRMVLIPQYYVIWFSRSHIVIHIIVLPFIHEIAPWPSTQYETSMHQCPFRQLLFIFVSPFHCSTAPTAKKSCICEPLFHSAFYFSIDFSWCAFIIQCTSMQYFSWCPQTKVHATHSQNTKRKKAYTFCFHQIFILTSFMLCFRSYFDIHNNDNLINAWFVHICNVFVIMFCYWFKFKHKKKSCSHAIQFMLHVCIDFRSKFA